MFWADSWLVQLELRKCASADLCVCVCVCVCGVVGWKVCDNKQTERSEVRYIRYKNAHRMDTLPNSNLLKTKRRLLYLTLWHRSFKFNSNESPTWCNNFSVYFPDVCLQLNMFWGFSVHHQELNDCSGSLWFYLRIVVTVVLCSWPARPQTQWIIHEPKKVALWNKRHFEEKNGECAACLKYSVLIGVHLEGSGTPALYIGRTVLKG